MLAAVFFSLISVVPNSYQQHLVTLNNRNTPLTSGVGYFFDQLGLGVIFPARGKMRILPPLQSPSLPPTPPFPMIPLSPASHCFSALSLVGFSLSASLVVLCLAVSLPSGAWGSEAAQSVSERLQYLAQGSTFQWGKPCRPKDHLIALKCSYHGPSSHVICNCADKGPSV